MAGRHALRVHRAGGAFLASARSALVGALGRQHQRRLPAARHGEASGAYNTPRELGGVFGIAVLGAVFQGSARTPPSSSRASTQRSGRHGLSRGRRRSQGDNDEERAEEGVHGRGAAHRAEYPPDGGRAFFVYAPAGIGEEKMRSHPEDIQRSVRLFSPGAATETLETTAAGEEPVGQ